MCTQFSSCARHFEHVPECALAIACVSVKKVGLFDLWCLFTSQLKYLEYFTLVFHCEDTVLHLVVLILGVKKCCSLVVAL